MNTQELLVKIATQESEVTTQISFETIDDLDLIWDSLREIKHSFQRINLDAFPFVIDKLNRLEDAVEDAMDCVERAIEDSRSALGAVDSHRLENRRILEFDNLLRKLADQITQECAKAQQQLDTRIADPVDPIGDFEIDVRIDYIADEYATGHSENSDNILASREYPMRVRLTGESRLLDGEWEIPNGSEIDKWPQGCWLFHDLVDHAYGPNNPKLALRKIDAIGTIWIDVIVRQQYCLDTRTGKWKQYHVGRWGN